MKNIILDTDIGPDCDDAAAVAVLNIYANAGLCRILGIGHCTSSRYGSAAADAVCAHYGNPDVPAGTYKGKRFLASPVFARYNRYLAKNFPNRFKDNPPGDVVELYRRLLSEAEDGSVCLVGIGPLNNVSALLDSPPDKISPLPGRELVRKKVGEAVFMAGIYPCASALLRKRAERMFCRKLENIPEFNVSTDKKSAMNVAENFPSERRFLGFEAGLIRTGGSLRAFPPGTNPVREAYRRYTLHGDRYSWDLFTVEFAIIGESSFYGTSGMGSVRFDPRGRTVWTPGAGTDRFVEIVCPPDELAAHMDALLARGTPDPDVSRRRTSRALSLDNSTPRCHNCPGEGD